MLVHSVVDDVLRMCPTALLKWLRKTVFILGPERTISSISQKRGHPS